MKIECVCGRAYSCPECETFRVQRDALRAERERCAKEIRAILKRPNMEPGLVRARLRPLLAALAGKEGAK